MKDFRIDSKLFYETLFDPEDQTCFGTMTTPPGRIPGIYETKLNYIDVPFYQNKNYVVINPMHTSRKIDNITKFRSFMMEMDYTSLDEQKRIVRESGLPYSCATYSGGKSIHFIVSLVTPLTDVIEYKKVAQMLYDAFEIKKREEDQANKNATRFSRTPNTYRADKDTYQTLLKVNGRIENSVFFEWLYAKLKSLNISLSDYEPKQYIAPIIPEGSLEMSDIDKYKWVKEHFVKKSFDKDRHLYLFMVASGCNQVGIERSNASNFMSELSGLAGGSNPRMITILEIEAQIKCAYEEHRSDNRKIFLQSTESFKINKTQQKMDSIYAILYK
jgi:hypothetical protein